MVFYPVGSVQKNSLYTVSAPLTNGSEIGEDPTLFLPPAFLSFHLLVPLTVHNPERDRLLLLSLSLLLSYIIFS